MVHDAVPAVQVWRVEHALKTAGLTTYGEGLVDLAGSLIEAVDTAGVDADNDQLAAIVAAHIGPEAISLDTLFGLAAESEQLMCEPAPATMGAECLIEALGQTVWSLAIAIVRNERALLTEMEETYQDLLAALAETGGLRAKWRTPTSQQPHQRPAFPGAAPPPPGSLNDQTGPKITPAPWLNHRTPRLYAQHRAPQSGWSSRGWRAARHRPSPTRTVSGGSADRGQFRASPFLPRYRFTAMYFVSRYPSVPAARCPGKAAEAV